MIPVAECEHIDRWDGYCPDCGDTQRPKDNAYECVSGECAHTDHAPLDPNYDGPGDAYWAARVQR